MVSFNCQLIKFSRITQEESLIEGLFRTGWPVGVSVWEYPEYIRFRLYFNNILFNTECEKIM